MILNITNLANFTPSTLSLVLKGAGSVTKSLSQVTISGDTLTYSPSAAEKTTLGSGLLTTQVKITETSVAYKTQIVRLDANDLDNEILTPMTLSEDILASLDDFVTSAELSATLADYVTDGDLATELAAYIPLTKMPDPIAFRLFSLSTGNNVFTVPSNTRHILFFAATGSHGVAECQAIGSGATYFYDMTTTAGVTATTATNKLTLNNTTTGVTDMAVLTLRGTPISVSS